MDVKGLGFGYIYCLLCTGLVGLDQDKGKERRKILDLVKSLF